MSLPVLAIPEDTIDLWSVKTPVTIRPYLVGEEKLLLMAQQTENAEEVKKAVKQIIRRCTFDAVNPDTLPSFDIEWLFLQLRSRSVSNIIESNFRCQNPVLKAGTTTETADAPMEPCNNLVKVRIDINDIKMTVPEGHTNKIMLDDTLGITMKYPTADVPDTTDVTVLLQAYLDTVFTAAGEVTEISQQTPADVMAWIDTLSLAHVQKIQQFFLTMPRLTHTFTFKCSKCGYSEDITLQGLMDFFD
jgi:hypothetical protein